MDEEKKQAKDFIEENPETFDERKAMQSAARARNRTIMLTPEITGQVRALLQPEAESSSRMGGLEDFIQPLADWEGSGNINAGGDDNKASVSSFGRSGLFEQGASQHKTTAHSGIQEVSHMRSSLSEAEPDAAKSGKQPSFSVNKEAGNKNYVGSSSRAPRIPTEPLKQVPNIDQQKKTKIVGFLVSFDNDKNGEVVDIRTGRWLLTSHQTELQGDYIFINDESISPLHAILRAGKDGTIQVLDQLSEFGTAILRVGEDSEVEISGKLETVCHGDILRFGQRKFVLCCVPQKVLSSENSE